MEDKRIPDRAFTASGSYDDRHRPSLARLNILSDGKHIGAWCPKYKSINQWLQIDLGEITAVTKVATQGRYNTDGRVKTYTLSYSVDGMHWTSYKQRGTEKVHISQNALLPSFSIFHSNVVSLNGNLENLQTHILEEHEFHFDVLGISETKITNLNVHVDISSPLIPGYNFEFFPTPLASGGVASFIDEKHNYRVLEFQALWI